MEVMGATPDTSHCGAALETVRRIFFFRSAMTANEQALINRIIDNRRRGKKTQHHYQCRGIGHSGSMAKRIEAATGIETRATILGHMQRGGTPTCKDRVYASIMGAKAAELLAAGKQQIVVAYKHGEFVDFDIQEALNMTKDIRKSSMRLPRC